MNKIFLTTLILTSITSLALARKDYYSSTTITSDVYDSYGVMVDYPSSAGNVSTTKGNVVIDFAEGVSLETGRFTIYGTGSSVNFLGNNNIKVSNLSIMGGAGTTGASFTAVNSTIIADQITLREGGTSITLTDCSTTVNGKMAINPNSTLTINGGTFIAAEFSQTGAAYKENVADVNIINGAKFTLTETESYAHNNAFNIYVDSTSTFDSTQKSGFYGTLTFEAGATVDLAGDSTITDVKLIVDDITQAGDISSYFETITMAGVELDSVLTSENFSTIVDKSTGKEYAIDTDVSGNFVVGSEIPEPSTYAMIFGALALAFVVYRRRK